MAPPIPSHFVQHHGQICQNRLKGDITIASSMLCINTGEEQFTSRAYKSPLDVPPLTEPGITYGCCKRGGDSDNTYQVVNTPGPSTLGMIAARGMEQVSCKSVSAPYLQNEVHHHIPQALTCGTV